MLKATRKGQTGCYWCQVDCRHYHWIPADYAPDSRDMLLDDFEPTYAVFAMLGLTPAEDTFQARLDLLKARAVQFHNDNNVQTVVRWTLSNDDRIEYDLALNPETR